MPELQIVPDRDRARRPGVSIEDLAQTVNVARRRRARRQVQDGGRRYDVRVRLAGRPALARPGPRAAARARAGRHARARSPRSWTCGRPPGLLAITRRDRERAITVFANVAPGASQDEAVDHGAQSSHAKLPTPASRVVALGPVAGLRRSRCASCSSRCCSGIVVAYMILALAVQLVPAPGHGAHRAALQPDGRARGPVVARTSRSTSTRMIGLLLLMGIVKKNSIILVDFTEPAARAGPRDPPRRSMRRLPRCACARS